MANAGGSESIGELRVDIVGDESGLDAALARTKQKLEDAGGGGKGGKPPSPPSPPSDDDDDPKKKPTGYNRDVADIKLITVLNAVITTFERMEKLGERIGNGLFEGVKQQAELTQALANYKSGLNTSQAQSSKNYNNRALGVDGNPAGNFADTEIIKLENENAAIEAEMADFGIGAIAEGVLQTVLTKDVNYQTGRDQKMKQFSQNQAKLTRLRAARDGPVNAGRATMEGAVVSRLDDEMGIPHPATLGNAGSQLGPAGAAALEAAVRGNTDVLRMLTQQLQSPRGQQKFLIEQLRGSPTQQGGD